MVASYGVTELEWDEELDLKRYPLWILWPQFVPLVRPLYVTYSPPALAQGTRYACEMLQTPGNKGFDTRLIDGYAYMTSMITTEEERKQREPLFRERLAPFIEDFGKEWRKYRDEMSARFQPLKKAELEKLSDTGLMLYFDEYLRVNQRFWDVHFYLFWAVLPIYILFEDICGELLGLGPHDLDFKKLMMGFDNELFRVNRELWHLGDRARELGVAEIFLTTEDDEQVLHKLEESRAGRKWLQEYRKFLKVRGWRTPIMLEWGSRSWIEQPSLGIAPIRQGLAKGGAFVLDEERVQLAKEREEAEREALAKIPADKRDWFGKLMRSAQQCGYWLEEHDYYLDLPANALGRHVTNEYGKRFAQRGVIDESEDIYFLLPGEIRKASVPMERVNLRRYVNSRKQEFEAYSKKEMPPFILGDPTKLAYMAQNDPAYRVQGAPQLVRPELKADLYGSGSAPGVVEGIARVIFSEAQLGQVQPGEILVAPATSAPWTPIFGIISGAVTDLGGSLFHAVIVGREYGIPAVCGTMEATKKIKTGDRIRVDGDNCAVYIMK
jgi:pyruvate,water dikinase